MKKKDGWKRRWILLLPLAPFLLALSVYLCDALRSGATGEAMAKRLTDAVFSAFRVYSMLVFAPIGNGQPTLGNWNTCSWMILEIARWGAVAVIAAAALTLMKNALKRIGVAWLAKRKDVYAVYGDAAAVSALKRELGTQAICADMEEKKGALHHIVAYRDAKDVYRFLDENPKLLERPEAKIYIYTDARLHPRQLDRRVIISDMAQNCARLFWHEHPLSEGERQIVIVGSGRYMEQMLEQALLTNVFLRKGGIRYHVLGDCRAYCARHPQMGQFVSMDEIQPGRDAVFFHPEKEYMCSEVFANADRVILCGNDEAESYALMDALVELHIPGRIYIRVHSERTLDALWRKPAHAEGETVVVPFGMDETLYTLSQSTNREILERGKLVHAYYEWLYGDHGLPPRERVRTEAFETAWNRESSYHRASSVAMADHVEEKARILLHKQALEPGDIGRAGAQYRLLDGAPRRALLELEHRRWMRFMWLSGWRFGEKKDDVRRTHPCLVPFEALPPKEQEKDGIAYEMMSVFENTMEDGNMWFG